MKIKSLFNRKAQVAFGSAIAILLVVGSLSYRSLDLSGESDRWVRHTHEVLENLQGLLLAMQSIESSGRGFALTGEESYLEDHRASLLNVEQHEAAVRNLTADNPEQQRHLPALERLAAQKIEFVEMVNGLRRAKGLEAAADAVRTGRGERTMNEFQGVVRKLRDEELRLLGQRNEDVRRRLGETKTALIFGAVLALLITAVAGWSAQRAETRRAKMEDMYRGLLEAAPDAMLMVNQGGNIALVNLETEKQFGYRRDELVGRNVKTIIPEGLAERLLKDGLRSTESAAAQQMGTEIELTGRRKNGSEFPIEVILGPLQSAQGRLVTAAIRDITTRKKAEAHLLRKMGELNRSNEELGQFAYIASHDLQEPLRMVASYTQLLSRRYKGKLDSDADEFIAFAVDGASRMQLLIQDLLAYSRVGTKGKELIDTSSEEALQQALINLRGAIEESGALVTHEPLPAVLADEMQLIQLFQNLVGNAIKYQGPGIPRVDISAARNGGKKWMFSVRDNGLGIDSQYFEKIFGMFQRLHKREEFAGTGIGLAICKKIVERHGGSISVESQLGKGSTFRFALAGTERKS